LVHFHARILAAQASQKSEFGVEWMRFEAEAAVPDLVGVACRVCLGLKPQRQQIKR
jgi:hypothetical protein